MRMCDIAPLLLAGVVAVVTGQARAQTIDTSSYQGRLEFGGEPAVGLYEIAFRVYNAAEGGALLTEQVRLHEFGVFDDGLFTIDDLSFAGVLQSGADRWLQLSVRKDALGAFTILLPRQAMTAAPSASVAGRLAMPYDDSRYLDGSASVRIENRSPTDNSYAGHFISEAPVSSWVGSALIAESTSGYGLIASGGPAKAGLGALARLDGSMGLKVTRMSQNPTGVAGVFESPSGDVHLGGASYAGEVFGDFWIDGDLVLTGEAVDSDEILDEAGVAPGTTGTTSVPTSGYGVMAAATITPPASGYVIAIASAELLNSHFNGVSTAVRYGVSHTTDEPAGAYRYQAIPGTASTGLYSNCVSDHAVFSVSGGTTRTFYFLAWQSLGSSSVMYNNELTLIYVPTLYSGSLTQDNESDLVRAGLQAPRASMSAAEIARQRSDHLEWYIAEAERRQAEMDRLAAEQRRALAAIRAMTSLEAREGPPGGE